jgi:hypothetical protein
MTAQPACPLYPHVITQGARRNGRSSIIVANEPLPEPQPGRAYVHVGEGYANPDGSATELGRIAILKKMRAQAKISKARYCVVWGPTSCTWIDGMGVCREGISPPEGDVAEPYYYDLLDMPMEPTSWIALPGTAEPTHLCIRRLDDHLVEIAPGEPIMLAAFDDPVAEGLRDPAERLLGPDGNLVQPETFRGQPVTGIRREWEILGPVQPYEGGQILRNPWPDDVRRACEAVAGRRLPPRIVEAAWQILHPAAAGVVPKGVHEAA